MSQETAAAPLSAVQIRVFVGCLAVSMLDGFDTQSTSFVAAELVRAWHLAPGYFGWLFSAGLVGTALGAIVFGALADRLGRRRVMSLTTLWFGAATLACGFAGDGETLMVLRFLAGLGLGGAVPNFLALASEYAPPRARATIVVVTLWGFPAGAALGAVLSTPLIERFGWQAVFILGGILPLVLGPALLALPESTGFAVQRVATPATPWRTIFSPSYARTTWLYGAALFLSLLLSYLLVAWIPLLFRELGLPLRQAVLGAVVLNLSGIAGSFLLSRLIDRTRRALVVMIVSYLAVATAVLSFGILGRSLAALLASVGLASFFLLGTQMSLTAHSAQLYPPALRASGAGFIQAVGRVGSMAGPLVGGWLVSAGLGPFSVVRAGVVPAVLAAVALLAAQGRSPASGD